MLYALVNPLTMWLTFGTFIGYAVIYTVLLKPATPQNIVIGGASGAMPPVLGLGRGDRGRRRPRRCSCSSSSSPGRRRISGRWRSIAPRISRKAGVPMLPVTHGQRFTRLYVLLYTLVLFASALLPFAYGMSGWIYLVAALVLSGVFVGVRDPALRQLQRRAGPAHVPLFDRLPGAAVRRAARRSLFPPVRACVRALFRVVLAAVALCGCSGSGPSFKNTDITGADYGKDFTLTDHTGKTRTLADFRGKVVVVFFGYTRCPDVCPTTLADLKIAKEQLGEDGKRLQVAFRHGRSGERHAGAARELRARVRPQLPRALRRCRRDRQACAKEFKVFYQKVAGEDAGQLYRGPHRRQLRVRSAGTPAPVRAPRQRPEPRRRCPHPE